MKQNVLFILTDQGTSTAAGNYYRSLAETLDRGHSPFWGDSKRAMNRFGPSHSRNNTTRNLARDDRMRIVTPRGRSPTPQSATLATCSSTWPGQYAGRPRTDKR